MLFFIYISFFLYTRVSDRSVSVMCRCGASATNGLCEEQRRPRLEAAPAAADGPAAAGVPPAR
jgi:hypothetical protein